MTATLPILSPLFLFLLCATYSLLQCAFQYASYLFVFRWRCWLLQYVVFLLHLSQDHKCVLAVWSLGVTCIHFVTHNTQVLSQLIVYVLMFEPIIQAGHVGGFVDVIALSYVISF